MSSCHFSVSPPPPYQKAATHSLFHGEGWQQMLRAGFGCTSLFGWDDKRQDGLALTIFRRAGFHIGFVGFPVGGTLVHKDLDNDWLKRLTQASFEKKPDVLRIVNSPFRDSLTPPVEQEPTLETAVLDLPNWSRQALSSSTRRNLRKAEKNEVQAIIATPDHAKAINQLYQQTIQRHDGQARYTPAYFETLLNLATTTPQLTCFLALHQQQVASFLIVGLEGQTAYYLHGGTEMSKQQVRPSDLLFATAIEWAQAQEATIFNLMASPIAQPSLVKFKEKWGGETRQQATFNLPLRPVRAAMFNLALSGYRWRNKWKQAA